MPASATATLAERLAEIGKEADALLQKCNAEPIGVGLAFPGIVDGTSNRILSQYVKYQDAQKVDLNAWAFKKWNIPLALENDARAALVGEWRYGAGRNCNDIVLITLGTGVGTAAMIDGSLIRGKHFLAGNLGGHMTINLHGDVCNCGNTGCLESEASTWALEKKVMKSPGYASSTLSKTAEINFNVLFNHAANGDELAGKIREDCLKAWSLGIINLIHAYDPERVILGGGIMKSKDSIIPYIYDMIKRDTWIRHNKIELVPAEQVEYAGILGMYYLISQIKEKRQTVL
jgi:glucokinase